MAPLGHGEFFLAQKGFKNVGYGYPWTKTSGISHFIIS